MASKTKNVTMEDYRTALVRADPNISKAQRAFLRAHYQSANHRATATDLARKVGYSQYRATNSIYGRLARKLLDSLGARVPRSFSGIGFLVESDRSGSRQHWQLRMRPHLVSALEGLGWFASDAQLPLLHRQVSFNVLPETVATALRGSRLGQGRVKCSLNDSRILERIQPDVRIECLSFCIFAP